MPPTLDSFGPVNNDGPGAVCAICRLGPEADTICRAAALAGFNQIQIAQAIEDGAHARHHITNKHVWHHLHHPYHGRSAS